MFEWVLGNIDGKSISISGKHGTVTLKPITREFLEQVPNIAELSDEELEAIDALKENIENLLSNNYDLLYCETYDRYSDLFDKLKVDYEIFNIEVNSGKPYRFQFFADDEFTLASYSLVFQIALGIGNIVDVKNKMLFTVITLENGWQIGLCPTDDGVDVLLGNMHISVGLASHLRHKQLRQEKERLYKEALKKHQAIIQALKDEANADKERLDYLQSLNILLTQAIKDLKKDLTDA